MAAILYFVKGDAELTLGDEKQSVAAGAFVQLAPATPHGILAKTPVVMMLLMLKQDRHKLKQKKPLKQQSLIALV